MTVNTCFDTETVNFASFFQIPRVPWNDCMANIKTEILNMSFILTVKPVTLKCDGNMTRVSLGNVFFATLFVVGKPEGED